MEGKNLTTSPAPQAAVSSTAAVQWQPLFDRVSDPNLSLQGRIRQMLVSAILSGHLPAGTPAPSSRQLSDSLGVARNTVVFAYQQLVAEGYLVSRERSGHFVADDVLRNHVQGEAPRQPEPAEQPWRVATWHQRLVFHPSRQRNIVKPENWQSMPYPFVYAQFDPGQFPTAEWRECCTRALSVLDIKSWAPDLITHDDPALIEEIRSQVLPRRGVWAEADEIVVTVGAQHALYLLADLLMHNHTVVGMEDPGYPDARNIFAHRTERLLPLPVDEQGLCITPALRTCDYIFVTPSHQCPTSVTLPMERRVALLELVSRSDGIVIEDDYETENRYDGQPSPALKSLDRHGRVIYVGSLSKSFAPGLRLGYIVAPRELVAELRALRRLMLRHPPAYTQRAFALFISLGHHHSLLRRLSVLYAERAQVLTQAVAEHLPEFELVPISGGSSGWIKAPEGTNTTRLAEAALQQGVVIEPGHVFFHRATRTNQNYIRVGFASIDKARIPEGIRRLAAVYRALTDPS
ncbi:aminotransferase class I/II-fold pyridoxal phosphate-dependent enzyme [Pusillimonas sp. TS35]|uniref:MocR-like pyridoxine biosynthesis transcription factor PdxR n=1 Tax=Paracandidimonas lactea TaxID=2895524 RepID=UPI00136D3420|nr:PLP-dependent aminotransferase family protein [Paracandidimonas lactea]MYN13800.1 aminotransferase class I/II-fold pyridoxal phosphate-dependent enzyme [Pusillimonas sp. TS35]